MVALGRSGDYLDLPPSIMTKVSVKLLTPKSSITWTMILTVTPLTMKPSSEITYENSVVLSLLGVTESFSHNSVRQRCYRRQGKSSS